MATPDLGSPFPDIDLLDEEGRPAIGLSGERLYAFFKTTCPTSSLAWPFLDRIHAISPRGKLAVLAVSQDDPATTARFNQELGVRIPTLYDPEPWKASETLGLTNVPMFFLVDDQGIVRDSAVGFQRHKMEEFAGRAAQLAGRPAPALFSPTENVPAIKPG